jgi:hypothetical protein
MKHFALPLCAFVIFSLWAVAGCAPVDAPKVVAAPTCPAGVPTQADDLANAEGAGFKIVGVLSGKDAANTMDFAGVDMSQAYGFNSILVTIAPDNETALVGVYDANDCRLGVVLLPKRSLPQKSA